MTKKEVYLVLVGRYVVRYRDSESAESFCDRWNSYPGSRAVWFVLMPGSCKYGYEFERCKHWRFNYNYSENL